MTEFRSDRLIMRDYITAMDHLQYTQLPDGIVAILLTHSNLQANHVDIRLDLHLSIADVKGKFRTHIGTHVEHQRLILKDQGRIICEMSDNTKMLGFYSVTSGMEIHVIDTDPFSLSRGGGLTDTSLVEKYRMSDEVYDKKSGTMRDFIRKKREANPDFKLPNSVVKAPKDPNAEPPPVCNFLNSLSNILSFNWKYTIQTFLSRLSPPALLEPSQELVFSL